MRVILEQHGSSAKTLSLVKGAAFKRNLDFVLASSMGQCMVQGTPFDMDLTPFLRDDRRIGILQGEQTTGNWNQMLDASQEYLAGILLIADVERDASPGTNIVESWHSFLRRCSKLCARKSFDKALMQLDIAARAWNCSHDSSAYFPSSIQLNAETGEEDYVPRKKACRSRDTHARHAILHVFAACA